MLIQYTQTDTVLVYFQGYLVSNHLPDRDLQLINLYLRHHCLVTSRDDIQLGQFIVWREVFRKPSEPVIPGFVEPEARHFLLAISMVSMFTDCPYSLVNVLFKK